jgi:hypothetical protein
MPLTRSELDAIARRFHELAIASDKGSYVALLELAQFCADAVPHLVCDLRAHLPAPSPLVHVLNEGRALCGIGSPVTWLGADRWVRVGEPGATCAECLRTLERALHL